MDELGTEDLLACLGARQLVALTGQDDEAARLLSRSLSTRVCRIGTTVSSERGVVQALEGCLWVNDPVAAARLPSRPRRERGRHIAAITSGNRTATRPG